ncbi:hypothetical protein LguiA_002574 [Lonicera macranthoides]
MSILQKTRRGFLVCYRIGDNGQVRNLNLPTITFHFTGVDVDLPAEQTFLEVEKGGACSSKPYGNDTAYSTPPHSVSSGEAMDQLFYKLSLSKQIEEPFGGKMVYIENDWDVLEMCKWIPAYRLIEIFVESVDCLVSSSQPEPEPKTDSEISVDNSCSDSLVDVDYIVSDDDFGQFHPYQADSHQTDPHQADPDQTHPQPEFQTHPKPEPDQTHLNLRKHEEEFGRSRLKEVSNCSKERTFVIMGGDKRVEE